jgi:hypothetical protein
VEATILGIAERCRFAIGVEARGASYLFPSLSKAAKLPSLKVATPTAEQEGISRRTARGRRFSEFLRGRHTGSTDRVDAKATSRCSSERAAKANSPLRAHPRNFSSSGEGKDSRNFPTLERHR